MTGYRIVMLDNNHGHIEALRAKAGVNCKEILSFNTIAAAMQWIDTKDHVDVIVSNAFLETENVFEFLKAVKQNESHNWIQFILVCTEVNDLTSFLNKTAEKTARILGADKYIMMSEFCPERLLKEIEASLPNMPPQKELDPIGEALGVPREPNEVPVNVNEAQKDGPKLKGEQPESI